MLMTLGRPSSKLLLLGFFSFAGRYHGYPGAFYLTYPPGLDGYLFGQVTPYSGRVTCLGPLIVWSFYIEETWCRSPGGGLLDGFLLQRRERGCCLPFCTCVHPVVIWSFPS